MYGQLGVCVSLFFCLHILKQPKQVGGENNLQPCFPLTTEITMAIEITTFSQIGRNVLSIQLYEIFSFVCDNTRV